MVEISSILLLILNLTFFMLLILIDKIGLFLVQWVIFIVWFFLFPSYLQYAGGVFPWPNYPTEGEVFFANILTLIFTFFLFLGYIISYKKKNVKVKTELFLQIDLKTNFIALLFTVPTIIFISIIGPMSFFMGRSTVGDLVYMDGFLPMLYALSKFSIFGVLIVYISIWLNRNKAYGFGFFSYIVMYIIILLNIVINNPLSSPRFHFLSMAIALAVVFKKMSSRLAYFSLFLISPFLLFILFPVVKHLGERTNNYNSYDISNYMIRGVDFDAFQQLVNIVRFVKETGYSWGLNFISGISFFIPRGVWESKPTNLGILAAEYQGYHYTNLSAPLVGEFYYAADLVGVIVGGVIFGVLAGKADSLLRNVTVSMSYFLGVWLSSFSFIIFRGSFGSVAPMITLGMCSSLFIYYMATVKIKKTSY